ncbi:MAG: hypothetical protein NVS9B13_25890 [Candidatus Acidiferrum sp.]
MAPHFLSPVGEKIRKVDHGDQNVLAKVDGHVVAQIFARQIFEHQPPKKKVEAVAPILENGDDSDSSGANHPDKKKTDPVTIYDEIRNLKNGCGYKNERANKENRFVAEPGGHYQIGEPHRDASRTKT